MNKYISVNKKGNEIGNNWKGSQRSLPEVSQFISHYTSHFQQKCKIAKLKNGRMDVKDIDIIWSYNPPDWDSHEQYRNIVSGVPGSDGYKEVRAE